MSVDPAGTTPAGDAEGEAHRAQGVTANNGTWAWLSKPDSERTAEDDEAMTLSAYAAAYHWARAARRGPENTARAEWLLARVWAVRRNGALALHHADRCMAGRAPGERGADEQRGKSPLHAFLKL